jgi:hypothetical protein
MSLSGTACAGYVRAARVVPRRKGGGSASCSVSCACNECEWLEGEKKKEEEEEEKLEGAESDISCFHYFARPLVSDVLSNLACLHKWVADTCGLKSAAFSSQTRDEYPYYLAAQHC